MKITSEVKLGFIGIVTAIIVIWGINYLLGKNLLRSKDRYYARYEIVNGLEGGAPVLMQGYKIGSVAEVEFSPDLSPPFLVTIDIEEKYKIRKGSIAEIFSADLLGSKAIRINASKREDFHMENDTLQTDVIQDMLSTLMADISPVLLNIQKLTSTLDSVGLSLNKIINDPKTRGTIDNIEKATGSLQASLADGGDISESLHNLSSFTSNLNKQNEEIAASIKNLRALSSDIKDANIDTIFQNLDALTLSLKNITGQIESGNGSAGKLIYNDSLYDHISSLSADLDYLIRDLNSHPEKYVQFSVFGRSKK